MYEIACRDRPEGNKTGRQTNSLPVSRTKTIRQTDRQTDTHTHTHTQIERQTDRQTDRHIVSDRYDQDRQTIKKQKHRP